MSNISNAVPYTMTAYRLKKQVVVRQRLLNQMKNINPDMRVILRMAEYKFRADEYQKKLKERKSH